MQPGGFYSRGRRGSRNRSRSPNRGRVQSRSRSRSRRDQCPKPKPKPNCPPAGTGTAGGAGSRICPQNNPTSQGWGPFEPGRGAGVKPRNISNQPGKVWGPNENQPCIVFNGIPFVTVLIVAIKILIYTEHFHLKRECVGYRTILEEKNFLPLFTSDWVLGHYYSDHKLEFFVVFMASFLIKGNTLEGHFGPVAFGTLVLMAIPIKNVVEIIQSYITDQIGITRYRCVWSFQGINFFLKVLTTLLTPGDKGCILGLPVPSKYLVWPIEVILSCVADPKFMEDGEMGEFYNSMAAGTLTGLLYVFTPLGNVVDTVISAISGVPVEHLPSSRLKKNTNWPTSTGPTNQC